MQRSDGTEGRLVGVLVVGVIAATLCAAAVLVLGGGALAASVAYVLSGAVCVIGLSVQAARH